MKQGNLVSRVVILILTVGIAIYLGFYILNTLHDPFSTTLAYSYTVNDSISASGLLVREEVLLPGQGGIVEATRSEGEKVGAGQRVALVYRDAQAQSDQERLDELALEIELLEHAIAKDGAAESVARLDERIFQGIVSLRAAGARGDYSRLESQVVTVKSGVLKRGYLYGQTLSAAQLSVRLEELKAQRAQLRQSTQGATTQITASRAGTFSSLVDGYESILSPKTASALTPAALSQLMEQGGAEQGNSIGKLITTDQWYFVCALPEDIAHRLQTGEMTHLRFSGDFTQDMDMRVERIGQAEGGQQVVLFSSNRYLSRTTLLRQQTAEVIFQSWSGLRIPKNALRILKTSKEDQETGAVTQTSQLGVYVLVGGRAEFKQAEVVVEQDSYYVVAPPGSGSRVLRAGDEVIVNATGLWDGELLEF